MTELKQLRDFAEQVNGIRPQERSLKGVVNSLISNYKGGSGTQTDIARVYFQYQYGGNHIEKVTMYSLENPDKEIELPIKTDKLYTYNGDGGEYSFKELKYIEVDKNTEGYGIKFYTDFDTSGEGTISYQVDGFGEQLNDFYYDTDGDSTVDYKAIRMIKPYFNATIENTDLSIFSFKSLQNILITFYAD